MSLGCLALAVGIKLGMLTRKPLGERVRWTSRSRSPLLIAVASIFVENRCWR